MYAGYLEVYTVCGCGRAETLSLSSLLSGDEWVGGCTVKKKLAINSLFQAEGDAANPLCEFFKLQLWGTLWNWSLHCVTVCKGDREAASSQYSVGMLCLHTCVNEWVIVANTNVWSPDDINNCQPPYDLWHISQVENAFFIQPRVFLFLFSHSFLIINSSSEIFLHCVAHTTCLTSAHRSWIWTSAFGHYTVVGVSFFFAWLHDICIWTLIVAVHKNEQVVFMDANAYQSILYAQIQYSLDNMITFSKMTMMKMNILNWILNRLLSVCLRPTF